MRRSAALEKFGKLDEAKAGACRRKGTVAGCARDIGAWEAKALATAGLHSPSCGAAHERATAALRGPAPDPPRTALAARSSAWFACVALHHDADIEAWLAMEPHSRPAQAALAKLTTAITERDEKLKVSGGRHDAMRS